ncbi:hypothetical protein [Shewanella xiamenensis]|uniref:hypothetical protein n=1 Tax=Shewanella xiamenensis TaxID=332186 RepID=UPI000849AC12|nr:hypothetical protein [Shewanella xiamenensis]ODR86710.1 hypothetical protein ABT47_16060 [Shewanella xiamenensis]
MSANPLPASSVLNTLAIVKVMRALVDQGQYSPVIVERHAGEFSDMAELVRYAHQGASVRIAALAFNDEQHWEGLVTANVLMAAYVVCQNVGHRPADVLAEVITGRVIDMVTHERWGLDDCDEAKHINAKNLYNTQLDKQGLSVWVVSWTQRMRINTPIDEASLDDFLRLHLAQHQAEGGPVHVSNINVRDE